MLIKHLLFFLSLLLLVTSCFGEKKSDKTRKASSYESRGHFQPSEDRDLHSSKEIDMPSDGSYDSHKATQDQEQNSGVAIDLSHDSEVYDDSVSVSNHDKISNSNDYEDQNHRASLEDNSSNNDVIIIVEDNQSGSNEGENSDHELVAIQDSSEELDEPEYEATASHEPLSELFQTLKALPHSYLTQVGDTKKNSLKIYGRFSLDYNTTLSDEGFYNAYEVGDGEAIRSLLEKDIFSGLYNLYSLLPLDNVSFVIRPSAGSFVLRVNLTIENRVAVLDFINSLDD